MLDTEPVPACFRFAGDDRPNSHMILGHATTLPPCCGVLTSSADTDPGTVFDCTQQQTTGGDMHRRIGAYVGGRVASGQICEATAEGVRSKLRSFADRWPNLPPDKITRRHVVAWMETPGLSPAYRRLRLSTLRGFCRWLIDLGVLTKDPCHGVSAPRQPKYAPRNLTRQEVAACVQHATDTRTRLAVLLMVQEGLRRVECVRAQVGDVDWHRNVLTVRGKGGGGNTTRVVPLSSETVACLRTYLEEEPHGAGALFRSRRNPECGVTAAHLGELVTDVMRAASVKVRARDGRSPHAFRHTCATDVLDACDDILVVRDMLGHASVRTTEMYTAGRVTHLRAPMAGRSYAQ